MTYSAYIFDLDGTLLDTLPDLVRLTNMVLERYGWPQRTSDEILGFVGDGGRVLLRRAVPPHATEEEIDSAFELWRELYPVRGHEFTKPYSGIPEVLEELKNRGAKLGVLSNKFDAAAQEVIADNLPNTFDLVRGEAPDVPRKPDPRGLQRMIDQLGVKPAEVAYVGDSGTDMKVASSVGAFPVGVSWGYRPVTELEDAGAKAVIDTPSALLLL